MAIDFLNFLIPEDLNISSIQFWSINYMGLVNLYIDKILIYSMFRYHHGG